MHKNSLKNKSGYEIKSADNFQNSEYTEYAFDTHTDSTLISNVIQLYDMTAVTSVAKIFDA